MGERRHDQLSQSLKHLANNRLMLRILLDLELNRRRVTTALENKGQLIQLFSEERLHRVLKEDAQNELDETLAESLLEHIAYRMYRDHLHRYSERQLMNAIQAYIDEWNVPYDWRQIAQSLARIGMLVPSGKRSWQFRDRISTAYYAAAAILHEPELLAPVLEEISSLWWRDVLELYVGIIHAPTKLFFDMMDRDILTTAHVAQYRELSDSVYDAIIDTLIERMNHECTLERRRIAVYLGESGHARAAEALIHAVHREKASNVVLKIAQALLQWTNQREFTEIKAAETSAIDNAPSQIEPFAHLMQTFLQLAAAQEENRAPFAETLTQLLQDPTQSKLCRGLCAIGLGCEPSRATVEMLFELAMSDAEEPFIAWCAVDSLTQTTASFLEPKAIAVFNERPQKEPQAAKVSANMNVNVAEPITQSQKSERRVRATYLLGWLCSGNRTRLLLRDRAIKDEDSAVRGYAVDSLLHLDLPDARQHIEKRLLVEDDPKVIRKCAEALTKIGAVSSLSSLEAHIYNEHARTRWALHKAIREIRIRNGIE